MSFMDWVLFPHFKSYFYETSCVCILLLSLVAYQCTHFTYLHSAMSHNNYLKYMMNRFVNVPNGQDSQHEFCQNAFIGKFALMHVWLFFCAVFFQMDGWMDGIKPRFWWKNSVTEMIGLCFHYKLIPKPIFFTMHCTKLLLLGTDASIKANLFCSVLGRSSCALFLRQVSHHCFTRALIAAYWRVILPGLWRMYSPQRRDFISVTLGSQAGRNYDNSKTWRRQSFWRVSSVATGIFLGALS